MQLAARCLAELCPRIRMVIGICSVPITCEVSVKVRTSEQQRALRN